MKRILGACLAVLMAVVLGLSQGWATEPAVPEQWKSLDATGLVTLAKELASQGDAAKDQRALLTEYIAYKYLADSATAKSVGAEFWSDTAGALRGDLQQAVQEQWRSGIRAAFAPDDATWNATPPMDFRWVTDALMALSDSSIAALTVTWGTSHEDWTDMPADALYGMARNVRDSGDTGAALRTRLVGHLGSQILVDSAKTRTVEPGQWFGMARFLKSDLSDQVRATWATALKGAFATDQQALAAMKEEDFRPLVRALQTLDDTTTASLVASWVNTSNEWQSSSPQYLVMHAGWLKSDNPDIQGAVFAAKRRLAAHLLAAPYLSSDAEAAKSTLAQWYGLAFHLGQVLNQEERGQLLSKLRSCYAGSNAKLSAMSGRDVQTLTMCLKQLGDTGTPQMVALWANTESGWQSWSPQELLWLTREVTAARSLGEKSRRRLADHLISMYLKDAASARQVSCRDWKDFAFYLAGSVSSETRDDWAAKLHECYTSDAQALAEIAAADAKFLAEALATIGHDHAGRFVTAWLNSSEQTGGASSEPLPAIGMGAKGGSASMLDLMKQLDSGWQQAFSEGRLSWKDCQEIALAWLRIGVPDKARDWGMKTYNRALGTDEARAQADSEVLTSLGLVLNATGLAKGDTEFPAFVTTFLTLARNGTLEPDFAWFVYARWGYILSPQPSRTVLQDNLLDSEGVPRPQVAKALTWASLAADDLRGWEEVIDARVKDQELKEDKKAMWMLTKAWARQVFYPNEPKYRRSRSWLDNAMAEAKSNAVRLVCLRQFVDYFMNIKQPAEGLSMIASVRGQFDEDQLTTVDSFGSQLQALAAALKADHERNQDSLEIVHKRNRLAYLRRRLVSAQAANDEQAMSELQTAIQQLEADLSGVGE